MACSKRRMTNLGRSSWQSLWMVLLIITAAVVVVIGDAAAAFQPAHSIFTTKNTRNSRRATSSFVSTPKKSKLVVAMSKLSASTSNTPPTPPPNDGHSSFKRIQHRNVVIVGGGLAGLSAALYLSQIDTSHAHITILDREDASQSQSHSKTTVASFAAAGMLAPQSERLPKGDLLDLCISSRRMYRDFTSMVESMAQEAGEDGAPYLWNDDDNTNNGLDPWSVGFVASGGFLAPAMAGDSVATWAPPEDSGTATWLDANQVRELEPSLHPDVVGGWWFPEDASVDARRLTCSLRAACIAAGIQFLHGDNYEVTSLDLADGTCKGLFLKSGRYMSCKKILIANGAWMRNLLPVPIEPHKGQSISLRMPSDRPPILRRVLFAQDSYIVPKADGRIVVGATVEAGSYDSSVTPAGLLHIITHALQLVPGLKDLPIEETWVGLRPTTPDKGPIIGKTPWDNLFLAGGYWRNGVLLAPKTGQLLASLMSGQTLTPEDETLLEAFAWDRFTNPEKSAKLNANSRYAASMHPIHSRTTGSGVSAAVGTELGSYSSARSATEERKKDRGSLWSEDGSDDDAFERAAAMGKSDAMAFSLGDEETSTRAKVPSSSAPDADDSMASLQPYEGSADALTVGAATPRVIEAAEDSLDDAYALIMANKAQQKTVLDDDDDQADGDEKPDPGFRIYHKDDATDEMIEVPPYTSPGEFHAMLQEKESSDTATSASDSVASASSDLAATYETIRSHLAKREAVLQDDDDDDDDERPDPGFRIYHKDDASGEMIEVPPFTSPGDFHASLESQESVVVTAATSTDETPNGNDDSGYNEQTFDGYTTIQEENSRSSRAEELEAMREARRKNRIGMDTIDVSKL